MMTFCSISTFFLVWILFSTYGFSIMLSDDYKSIMSTLKLIIWSCLILFVLAVPPVCGDLEQMECMDDIYTAYPVCKKAAEEKGKDINVDLSCFKYFSQMTEECWGCICWFAKLEKWKVIGCDWSFIHWLISSLTDTYHTKEDSRSRFELLEWSKLSWIIFSISWICFFIVYFSNSNFRVIYLSSAWASLSFELDCLNINSFLHSSSFSIFILSL